MTVSQATTLGDRVVVAQRGEGVIVGAFREHASRWHRGVPTRWLVVELDAGGRCVVHPSAISTPEGVAA